MTIKIKATQIGIKKPIEIKPTINVVDSANEMLIKIMTMQTEEDVPEMENASDVELTDEEKVEKEKADNKQLIDSLKQERTSRDELFAFLKTILKLSDKEIEHAKTLIDMEELGEYIGYVIGRIKGRSDADFELDKKLEEEKESDPKED